MRDGRWLPAWESKSHKGSHWQNTRGRASPTFKARNGLNQQPQREGATKGGGVENLLFGSLERKYQFGSHVEIMFSADCGLDQDIPVNRVKVSKTHFWL